jgi:DNA-binding transcriptional regulator YiaG
MKETKTFDAVKLMREIREKLGEKYFKNPEVLKKEMQAIREKYNLKIEEHATV